MQLSMRVDLGKLPLVVVNQAAESTELSFDGSANGANHQ
jgi:hypothetical protein